MDSSSRLSHLQRWAPTVREEFVCYQERDNEHDRHTVAVYRDGDSNDVLGHLSREILRVAFLFWSMMAVLLVG